ncbi:MAG: hypothetical protein ACXAD7_22645 [Candidatus Kariarchaeaceae archaeon]|jgi:hypothetical protein
MLIIPNIPVLSQTKTSDTIPLSFTESVNKSFTYTNEYDPSFPNVTEYVDNDLSNFDPIGSTVYVGSEPVYGFQGPFYYVTVTLTELYVIDDHDGLGLGAGEIFIQGGVNGERMRLPSSTTEYSLNNDESAIINQIMFTGVVKQIGFNFEVRESDIDFDDSLGFVFGSLSDPVTETIDLTTDVGDAILTFDITVSATMSTLNADQILTGYQPYMFVDDETSATEMPDLVAGRVIQGDDNGRNAIVLQYYFYWETENTPTLLGNFETHANDFEVLLVYLDASEPTIPYRLVFNNWFYTDLTEFPSESILILEEDAIPGTYEYEVAISPELQGLLGSSTSLQATVKDISEVANWPYSTLSSASAWSYSPIGMVTIDLTVETSYHTFDLGPGGNEYGFNYDVSALTDDIIRQFYAEAAETFELGVHIWTYFGVDVPYVAPFAHDITQVFTKPYLISAYSSIVEDAAKITRAQNTYFNIKIAGYIGIELIVPADLTVSYPSKLSSGTHAIEFDITPQTDDIKVILTYGLSVNVSYLFWFLEGDFDFNHEGSITINPLKNEVVALAKLLGMDMYEKENVPLGAFISLPTLNIYPTMTGTIIDGSLSLDLATVLSSVLVGIFPPIAPLVKLLEFAIDGIYLVVNATLAGSIKHPLTTNTDGVSFDVSEVTYQSNTAQTVAMTIEDDVDLSKGISLNLQEASYILSFDAEWSVQLVFNSPVSIVLDDIVVDIGTYPNWTANALQSDGGNLLLEAEAETSNGIDFRFSSMVIAITIFSVIRRRTSIKRSISR